MPGDLAFRALNAFHKTVATLSFGRLGWSAWGMPVVELTTTGRRSGRPRTVLLTSPYQEGSTIVVVASRGGDDRNPAWFLNLRDDPQVEVSVAGGPRVPMRARIADADTRARLWPRVVADHDNYAGYQRRTEREIPLVLLEPEPG